MIRSSELRLLQLKRTLNRPYKASMEVSIYTKFFKTKFKTAQEAVNLKEKNFFLKAEQNLKFYEKK